MEQNLIFVYSLARATVKWTIPTTCHLKTMMIMRMIMRMIMMMSTTQKRAKKEPQSKQKRQTP